MLYIKYFTIMDYSTTDQIKMEQINESKEKIDFYIINNLSICLKSIDMEEKEMDMKLGQLKSFIFKEKSSKITKDDLGYLIYRRNLISDYIIYKSAFKKWENSIRSYNFIPFIDIIEKYSYIKEENDGLYENLNLLKEKIIKKYIDSKRRRKNYCDVCFKKSSLVINNIIEDVSFSIEDEISEEKSNISMTKTRVLSNTKQILSNNFLFLESNYKEVSQKEEEQFVKSANSSFINKFTMKQKIDHLEKRIKQLNNKYEKENSAYENLLIKKKELEKKLKFPLEGEI